MRAGGRFVGICLSFLALGILLAAFLSETARAVLLALLMIASLCLFLCA